MSFPPLPGLLGPASYRCGLGSLVSLSWEGGINHSLQQSVQQMHTHSYESSYFFLGILYFDSLQCHMYQCILSVVGGGFLAGSAVGPGVFLVALSFGLFWLLPGWGLPDRPGVVGGFFCLGCCLSCPDLGSARNHSLTVAVKRLPAASAL